MDQYKVGTVTDSQSTMHKLSSTPITLDCFETDDYDGMLLVPQTGSERIERDYDYRVNWYSSNIIYFLEDLRLKYLETKDQRYWKELIRWLPSGWNQTRTWTANYSVLRNIYHWRRDHRLTEWHQFCDFIKTLPYAEELLLFAN